MTEPLAHWVRRRSLKWKLIRNVWRAAGPRTRTELLAWAFDDWFFDGAQLEELDPECRWIFNTANLTTGVRFAFEREVLGDHVTGHASTRGTGPRVATAVAASAAVPGAFAALTVRGVEFPCGGRVPPKLVDGGAYDNTGLEALDGDNYQHVFTITINADGSSSPVPTARCRSCATWLGPTRCCTARARDSGPGGWWIASSSCIGAGG